MAQAPKIEGNEDSSMEMRYYAALNEAWWAENRRDHEPETYSEAIALHRARLAEADARERQQHPERFGS